MSDPAGIGFSSETDAFEMGAAERRALEQAEKKAAE